MKTTLVKILACFFLVTGFRLTAAGAALASAHSPVDAPLGIINPRSETTFFRALDISPLDLGDEQTLFLQLINEYRVQNGHSTLEINSYLQTAAQWHSKDMADKNYFSHTDSLDRDYLQRMADFGYTVSTYKGENIAAGYSTAASVFQGWKNSPGHNANMLNSNYLVIGIGLAYNDSSKYGYYWTTDFGGIQTNPALSPTVTSTPGASVTATPTTLPNATPPIKLAVYPNPTKSGERVFFEFQGHESVNVLVEVRVFNISGNIISKFSKNISSLPARLELL